MSDAGLKKDGAIQASAAEHLEQVRARLSDSIFWYASYVEWLDAG